MLIGFCSFEKRPTLISFNVGVIWTVGDSPSRLLLPNSRNFNKYYWDRFKLNKVITNPCTLSFYTLLSHSST